VSPLPPRATGAAVVAVLLAAVPLAAGCAAGQNAQTKKERFAVGAFTSIGTVRLENIALHPAADSDQVNGAATLTFSVYNQGQQPVRLTGIRTGAGSEVQRGGLTPSASASASASPSTSASASVSASTSGTPSGSASASASPSSASPTPSPTPAALPITVPPGGGLAVGPSGPVELTLTGLDQGIRVGRTIDLIFTFDPGGSTPRVHVPVTQQIGGTAPVSTPTLAPTSYPPEDVNPSFTQPPYDDRTGSPEPSGSSG
jgi:hypothetical protein